MLMRGGRRAFGPDERFPTRLGQNEIPTLPI